MAVTTSRAFTRPLSVLIVASTLGGCSMGLSGPQPNRARLELPKCDTGKGPVVIDGVWTAALGVTALASFGADAPEVGLLSLGLGVAFLAAAVRGSGRVDECRAAVDDYNVAREQRDDLDRLAVPTRRARRSDGVPRTPAAPLPPAQGDGLRSADGTTAPAPAPAPAATEATAAAPAVAPAPAPARPTAPATPARAARAEPEDDWSDFWKELP